VCVVRNDGLGTSATGASTCPGAGRSGQGAPNASGQASAPPAAEVPENAVVLTVYGVCPSTPKPAASKLATAKGRIHGEEAGGLQDHDHARGV